MYFVGVGKLIDEKQAVGFNSDKPNQSWIELEDALQWFDLNKNTFTCAFFNCQREFPKPISSGKVQNSG